MFQLLTLVLLCTAFQLSCAERLTLKDLGPGWHSKLKVVKTPKKTILKGGLTIRNDLQHDINQLIKAGHLFGPIPHPLDHHDSGWPFEEVTFDHPIQSPVDIITSRAVTKDLPMLDIIEPGKDKNVKAKFFNTGHTVQIEYEEQPENRPYLVGGPLQEKFIFEQIHFHWGSEDIWGSEHFVDGESFAVEGHGVYYNSKYGSFQAAAAEPDGLAVIAIFAEATSEDNPLLDPLHKLLPELTIAHSSVYLDSADALQWFASALSLSPEYYTYPGSLTTKPFSENVVFIILPQPITLSYNQLKSFRDIEDKDEMPVTDNKRNLQPLHNRPIVRGTEMQ